eukprot:521490_1
MAITEDLLATFLKSVDAPAEPDNAGKVKKRRKTEAHAPAVVAASATAQPSTVSTIPPELGAPAKTMSVSGSVRKAGTGVGGNKKVDEYSETPSMMTEFESQQRAYNYDPKLAAQQVAQASEAHKDMPSDQGQQHGSKKNIRVGGGRVWEDSTLNDWPDSDFRLFVGDLGNEVHDDMLAEHFSRYSSFAMAKIVRSKSNGKSKGFGFVSFLDGFDMMKALREQNGKYLGNRPIKLQKSTWKDRDIKEVRKREKKKKHEMKLALD